MNEYNERIKWMNIMKVWMNTKYELMLPSESYIMTEWKNVWMNAWMIQFW